MIEANKERMNRRKEERKKEREEVRKIRKNEGMNVIVKKIEWRKVLRRSMSKI